MAPSSQGFSIRPVTATDVPSVVAHVRTVLAEFGLSFGVGSASDAELFDLPHTYEGRGGAFWVAVMGDPPRIVGTAGVMPVGGDASELRKMYLSPETRGKGMGGALLERVIAHARAHGAHRLVLDTVNQMKEAIAFYERHGFVRDDAQIRGARCDRGYTLRLDP